MSSGTILYIGGFELPDKNAAAHRVISNGKILRELGYKVVFCGMNKDSENNGVSTPQEYYGFECYSLNYPNSTIDWFKYIIEYNYYVHLIKSQENVKAIICYNLPSGSLYRLKNYCNSNQIKIISDCTEWYEAPKEGGFLNRKVKKGDIFWRMRNLHFKMDGIISISEYLDRYYSVNNQNSIKVPPLVDVTDTKWQNDLVVTNRPVQFIYSGSPFSLTSKSSAKDRLDLIIKAMSNLKKEGRSFFLHIVGIELENFIEIYPNFKDEIESLKDSISFYGRVSHSESVRLLKSSDFSIFIRDENIVTKAGFPTKFVESITCGIPVLTNKNSNIVDYLTEGENGFLISTESDKSIQDSIDKAISLSPEEIYKMKVNCKKSQVFDYHNFLDDFKSLLK
ncbi:glycosyltransferase [Ulvibacter litoralis]|uniref:Glycosyltransferase involved in cell wall bisynthesis n=1 Tax=Ulvibacter litoralis TaxID=227084 RepID=A0A1G7HNJ6_9FLAO|nr:glycosyltransferase [Ulvibacter litoralis]SDF02017.1 Glycosyltransferase involved in cell wall bisynthesis [Ulvibacter litoralis]